MNEKIDLQSTAIPVIASLFPQTYGSVLEMGSGWYSTILLHMMCGMKNRSLITVDNDLKWIQQFNFLHNDYHKIVYIDDWQSSPNLYLIENKKWGMVLIDQAPIDERNRWVKKMADSACYIIAHDTQASDYNYDFSYFKYRYDFKLFPTWTTVVSNIKPIKLIGV